MTAVKYRIIYLFYDSFFYKSNFLNNSNIYFVFAYFVKQYFERSWSTESVLSGTQTIIASSTGQVQV
jgi:hypothetical protein